MATKKSAKKSTSPKAKRGATKSKSVSNKKLSALDAAAIVLTQAKGPMNTKAMIDAMSTKGLWQSPTGKTPQATLYSALLREITTKGDAARFKKADRGQFIAKG